MLLWLWECIMKSEDHPPSTLCGWIYIESTMSKWSGYEANLLARCSHIKHSAATLRIESRSPHFIKSGDYPRDYLPVNLKSIYQAVAELGCAKLSVHRSQLGLSLDLPPSGGSAQPAPLNRNLASRSIFLQKTCNCEDAEFKNQYSVHSPGTN